MAGKNEVRAMRSRLTRHELRGNVAWSSIAVLFFAACSSASTDHGSGGSGASAGHGGSASSTTEGNGTPSAAGTAGTAGDPGLGQPPLPPGDAPSDGGTITFQSIGAEGWFPSRSDPASGDCDAYQTSTCCLAKKNITTDALTPWNEDLILTLRGPMQVAQLVVYQPDANNTGAWDRISTWDTRAAAAPTDMAFDGNKTDTQGFQGTIGTECLVNVSTSTAFACGPGSSPYCPPLAQGKEAHLGWSGSKLFVMLATMPHADAVGSPCSTDDTGNWFDAPWLGLSVGELVRAGSFVSCQCYAKDPTKGYLADGCGQFNVFEVVNDNNSYKNLDVFSTDMIDYAGYVGEGPCGPQCDVSTLGAGVDLIDKSNDTEAAAGAISNPMKGPGAALRRPEAGYRYFVVLMDVTTRTVQLAVIHPGSIPGAVSSLLPNLPAAIDSATLDAVRGLRLPH
jgi:Putative TOS1-like glycosyl hydrolase (DUF2401)/Glycine-rich protein domain (DUF2403)